MINRIFRVIRIILLISIPIILWILPADHFNEGVVVCPSKGLFDIECLGCGMTRAVQHAMHFEFEIAWSYNKLVVIALPLLFFYWLHLLRKWIKQLKEK